MNRMRTVPTKLGLAAFFAASGLFGACNSRGGGGSTPPDHGLQNLQFDARVDIDVGAGGLGQMIARDLDGDGRVDLAVASWTGVSVRIAHGNPDGTFSVLAPLATPSSALALDAGDLNGDGRLDLAVACVRDGGTQIPNITVFEQDANHAWLPGYSFALAHSPSSIVVGSVDGVHTDMFVALEEEREVWQLRVTAPQTISLVAKLSSLAAGDGSPVTVALIDANGDGPLDVAVGERHVAGGFPDRAMLYTNDGFGNFGVPIELATNLNWPIVQTVDADGDAFPDLAISQIYGDDVFLLSGSATGFSAPAAIPFGAGQFSVTFGDFDADGTRDIAAPLFAQGSVAVRTQKTLGTYDSPNYFNLGNGARSLFSVQLPGDQRTDLVCSNFDSVSVLKGRGDGTFVSMRGFPVGDRPQYVRAADFDADGKLDVVSVDQFQEDVVFLRGKGDGTFDYVAAVPLDPSTQETPGYLIIGDFDEDGLPDAMASVLESHAVQLMRNKGGLPLSSLQVDRIQVGNEPRGIDTADLNGDGHLDVVVANSLDHTLQVLLGHGDGSFDAQLPIPLADRPLTVYCADLDGDGNADVALGVGELDGSGAKLLTWRGDGQGHLGLASSDALTSTALVMASGDFDRNGLPDLALSQFGYPSDSIYVLINKGHFKWTQQKIKVGNNPGTLLVADVDLDGKPDLIAPLGIGQLRVLLGDGKGGFQTSYPKFALDLPSPFSTNASAWADVNGDKLPDLLLIAPESIHLWVGLNTSH